ncbi:hypothetical protein EDD17DRAFT_1902775 [Pisolithus thermaeus]|nr:hypothetical protein EV401DRAFT_2159670 [Pisolithus croceorrhizus]KAI6139892.1 hypothetical protein EDD17DRAFT_1902775 [Pisolithus thermaeus]
MFDKTIGKIIPVRIRIPWWRDKSVRTQHDYSAAITLPMVQAAAAAIPVVGSPLAAAIGGLVAIVNVINTSIQNREALDTLTRQLYNLCCHLANAPTPRTPIEEISRQVLTKELENTTKELLKMQGCRSGSARLTQDIAGCSSKISNFLLQFMVSSQWQLSEMMHTMHTKIDYMSQFAVGQDGRLLAVMTVSCAVVIDATGEEHHMPLDQCCSFEQLIAFLPGILSKCRPDKAHIQQWYIDRGQYGFVIDNGTNMTQLTRESDVWSTIELGTKIVMRVITTEVSRRLSASYQCHCGKWNEVKVDQAAVMDALKDGFTVTCFYCERRLQIIVTKGKKALRQQVEQSQTKDDEPVIEEKILIRNMLRKQEEVCIPS